MEDLKQMFDGKRILITGGCGTIGSEILRQLVHFNPAAIRVIDTNEEKLFLLEEQYREHNAKHNNIRFLLGNICDKERMARAFEGIDVVFHTAALKHVILCEYSPFEAAKTNILGTQNLIDAAIDANVEYFIYTSSDKAVNPSNVMGSSKLFAEKLVTSANYYKGSRRCIFASVRFGNVLGSSGSVIPLFKSQIASGGPVTITDHGMTRFVMLLEHAVSLIFKACSFAAGGEIFILKMPVIKISDLADVMITELAPKSGYAQEQIKLKLINPKPGEKLYEELLTDDEVQNAYETDELYVLVPKMSGDLVPKTRERLIKEKGIQYKKATIASYKSNALPTMSKIELKNFLKSGNLM